MPIYEYTCKDCGHKFEKMLRIFEIFDEVLCPECQSKNLEKKFSHFTSEDSSRERYDCNPFSGRFT